MEVKSENPRKRRSSGESSSLSVKKVCSFDDNLRTDSFGSTGSAESRGRSRSIESDTTNFQKLCQELVRKNNDLMDENMRLAQDVKDLRRRLSITPSQPTLLLTTPLKQTPARRSFSTIDHFPTPQSQVSNFSNHFSDVTPRHSYEEDWIHPRHRSRSPGNNPSGIPNPRLPELYHNPPPRQSGSHLIVPSRRRFSSSSLPGMRTPLSSRNFTSRTPEYASRIQEPHQPSYRRVNR